MPSSGDGGAGSESAQLKSLKMQRGQVKAQCTRFVTYLSQLDIRNTSVIELRQRLLKFNETWSDFNAAQAAIEEIEQGLENARNHEKERFSFEERYFHIASEIETLIESKTVN